MDGIPKHIFRFLTLTPFCDNCISLFEGQTASWDLCTVRNSCGRNRGACDALTVQPRHAVAHPNPSPVSRGFVPALGHSVALLQKDGIDCTGVLGFQSWCDQLGYLPCAPWQYIRLPSPASAVSLLLYISP